jgi:hypothetical protein
MKNLIIGVVVGGLAAAIGLGIGQAQEPTPHWAAYDKGPATIDVSRYPPEMKTAYKLYVAKCGKCHTLARSINADFVLEDEWERYIKRMMRKAGSFITPEDGKQIFDFVMFDSKTRRKDLYEQRLKESKGTGN